jgi:hypothetical protein
LKVTADFNWKDLAPCLATAATDFFPRATEQQAPERRYDNHRRDWLDD